MSFYAAFFDCTLHYTGPFDSPEACQAHADACAAIGDGADYRGAVPVADAEENVDVSSPEDDLQTVRNGQA
jgi:hypothetical protein